MSKENLKRKIWELEREIIGIDIIIQDYYKDRKKKLKMLHKAQDELERLEILLTKNKNNNE